jgi:hypothetical protein
MKDRFSISVFRRSGDFVVVPENGGGGVYFAVEPISRVPPTLDELTRAIDHAVAISDLTGQNVNLRDYKSPVPRAVGLKSNRKFDDSVRAYCSVLRWDADIEITLWRRARDGRGFEPTDKTVKLPPRATAAGIAQSAIQLMSDGAAI